jgi:hypothetical protein
MKEKRNAQKIFVGKSETKSPLRRCVCSWEKNITGILKERKDRALTEFIWLKIGIRRRLL